MEFETICTGNIATDGESFGSLFGPGADWKVLVLLGLMASVAALAVVYMVANLMRNLKLVAWVNAELFQVVATGVLATFIMVWVAGMCHFPISFLDERYMNPDGSSKAMFQVADEYLSWSTVMGTEVFSVTVGANYIIGRITSFFFNFDPLGVGSRMAPMGAFSQISNLMFVMLSGFMISFIVIITQRVVIQYISIAMLYYFLPLGLIMRAFAPTREFGGAMVGMAVALMLFYPLTIVFNDLLVRGQIEDNMLKVKDEFKTLTSASDWLGVIKGLPAKILTGFSDGFLSTMFKLFGAFLGYILLPMKAVSWYVIVGVILPIFDFVFIIGITKELSKTMGEEVDVTNITRLI